MMDKDREIEALQALFQDARANPPAVPEALMTRILADAEALQPNASAGGWRTWVAALGGLPALGGLVTATCVGFWLGFAPPAVLPDLAQEMLGVELLLDDSFDAPGLSGFGWDIEEG